MKKITKIFTAIVLSIGFGISANAQNSNATMTSLATVFDAINVTSQQALNFGQIMKGTKKTVIPSSETPLSTGNAASATGVKPGIFRVDAGAGASVSLSFGTMITEMTRTSGTGDNLPITFVENQAGTTTSLAAFNTSTALTGQTPFAANLGYNFDGADGRTTFPSNDISGTNGIYVFIGGTVNASSTLAAGSFTGAITLTATYN